LFPVCLFPFASLPSFLCYMLLFLQ
jgi:hypothetical protein